MGKKQPRKRPRKTAQSVPAEDRRAEALTVAWMLSTLVTLGALICSGLALLVVWQLVAANADTGALELMPGLMLAVAIVTGGVSQVLMGLAVRLRRVAPPRPILAASAAIGFCPFVVLLVTALW